MACGWIKGPPPRGGSWWCYSPHDGVYHGTRGLAGEWWTGPETRAAMEPTYHQPYVVPDPPRQDSTGGNDGT